MIASASWLVTPPVDDRARLRLFCFPYAGGGTALYRAWSSILPPFIEVCPVQLPGRERRFQEPAFGQMDALIDSLAPALTPYLNVPYAFFGHSMGSLIGFELAREFRRRNVTGPDYLFVSGRRGPHMLDPDPPTYNLPDDEFIEELRTLEGTPPEVLEHPELMELMLPLLRADFELCDTYKCDDEQPLDCPVSAFGGYDDPETTREELNGWAIHSSGPYRARMYPGNHFFLQRNEAATLHAIAQDLLAGAVVPR